MVVRAWPPSLEVLCHPLEESSGHSISSLGVTWQWCALFPHFCNLQIARRLGLQTDTQTLLLPLSLP